MTVSLAHYLALSSMLFLIGLWGVIAHRRNAIALLMALEIMLLAVNINFAAFSFYGGSIAGQVFAMIVLTVAAAETAIGLAILVAAYRHRSSIAVDDFSEMKG